MVVPVAQVGGYFRYLQHKLKGRDRPALTESYLARAAAGSMVVRVEQFEQARRRRTEDHKSFTALARPIVGYIGSLRCTTDLALLARAAELAPDLQFVLAGPHFADVS